MISIIISTYQPNFLEALKDSIEITIGVPYEIIAIENVGEKGICEVYNMGANEAKYEILCFCHEDILFKTTNWGQIVINLFDKNTNLGLLGVAGSTYKSAAPAGWGLIPQARSANLIQHYKFREDPPYQHYENPQNKSLASVACIDGVFMCTTKKIALQIKFDQITFKSFHCYDIDFSLAVFKKYDIAVTFDILIDHFSEGKNDALWIEENLKLYKKWVKYLPLNMGNLSVNITKRYETNAVLSFAHMMETKGYSLINRLTLLIRFFFSNYIIKSELLKFIVRTTGSHFKKKLYSVQSNKI